jgi:hypothetical protein
MPRTLEEEIQGYYVDQAPYRNAGSIGDKYLRVSAIYTPWGIHRLDDEFARRIHVMTSVAEADKIKADIEANPHLHAKIKENLLENLSNFRRLHGLS